MMTKTKEFYLKPLEGIMWDGHMIPFGSSTDEVEAVFGRPSMMSSSFGEPLSYYYFDNELRFDFDGDELVFVEFLGGIDGELQPEIFSVPAFQTRYDELYRLLEQYNNGEVENSTNGYAYAFMEISAGVSRSLTEDEVSEMLESVVHDGQWPADEDIDDELRQALYWETIGIGAVDYYRIDWIGEALESMKDMDDEEDVDVI